MINLQILTMVRIEKVLSTLKRKKIIDLSDKSELIRRLSILDLTALGIGSTLGAGVYMQLSKIARDDAGPAIIISLVIAAIASMLAGLCYAEFGARVPKAGSAYVYSYVTMGEFMAFIIGWNVILEYMIGAASISRAFSNYFDETVCGNFMERTFSFLPEDYANFLTSIGLSKYPDFFAFGIAVVVALALSFKAKESSIINILFTIINLCVVLFVIIVGFGKVNMDNWKKEITPNITAEVYNRCTEDDGKADCGPGFGGFAPFGFKGIIAGAAASFYNFIGFDCIATAGEEAKNPKKSIPFSIIISLFVVLIAYLGISITMTTVLPYYFLTLKAPLPHMFEEVKIDWAKKIIGFGAMSGLLTSLLGAMFPLPRIIQAMASDGLIFRSLGGINSKFHTPMLGTLLSGLFVGILAMMLDVNKLMDMMSIGTLFAYSMVAACVIVLRYEESLNYYYEEKSENESTPRTVIWIAKKLINSNQSTISTKLTSQIVSWLIFIYFVCSVSTAFFIKWNGPKISEGCPSTIGLLGLIIFILFSILMLIYRQPVSGQKLTFSVPLVPFLPASSILINMGLIVMLPSATWIQFLVWMAIGFIIYFAYGVWNSSCRHKINAS